MIYGNGTVKNIRYLAILFLVVMCADVVFAQCPSIDYYNRVTNPTHNAYYIAHNWDTAVTCTNPCISLRDTSIVTTQSYNGTYLVSSIPYDPPDTTFCSIAGGGHQLPIYYDDVYDNNPITLPFGFVFFGHTYTQAVVGGNGVVSFGRTKAGETCPWSLSYSTPIPNVLAANHYHNAIFGILQDIDPGISSGISGQGIYVSIYGQYPCRKLVVSWKGIPHYSSGSSANTKYTTAQIVCYEGTNVIEVHVKRRVPQTSWDNGRGVIGIQDSVGYSGTPAHAFFAPGRNTFNSSILTSEAWRFTPQGSTTRNVTWYYGTDTAANTCHLVTNSDSATVYRDSQNSIKRIHVCPTVPTTYTMRLRYTGANGIHYDLISHVTVGVDKIDSVSLSALNPWSCPEQGNIIMLGQPSHNTIRHITWSCSNPRVAYTLNSDSTTIQVQPYTFSATNTQPYDSATFNATILLSNGCTQTNSVTIRFIHAPDSIRTASICENDVYTFEGNTYTTAGTYTINTTTAEGCPYQKILHLSISPDTYSTLFDTIVENQLPHTFNGTTFHSDTTGALITIANANGCDSNITYSLFVYPNVYASADSTICQNALPLSWNGVTFPTSALSQSSLPLLLSLNDTLLAHTGADSILTMRLHVNRNTYNTYFDTVVENQLPRIFNGAVFNDAVSASPVIIPNNKGCDSIIAYSLFVYRNVTATIDSTICQNSLPLSWNDSVFLAAGNKQTLLLTSHGADSLLTMRLHVNPNTYSILHDTIVQNQLPHTFHTLTLSGDTSHATVIIQNARGCDSIINYSLYYWRNVTASADSVICQNSLPLSWNGTTFNLPSSWRGPDTTIVHTALLQTSHGADSLLTMRLSVHPNTYSTYFDTVIENLLPRSFNGISFSNDTSNAIITITNANGCDSLISYSLFVHRNVATYLDSTICQSNLPLLWNNYTFQTAGTHTVTFPSATEADSVVMMRLFVNPTTYATLDSAIIENTLPLTWNGVTFNGSMMHATTTRYYDTLQNTLVNSRGCDSVVTMRLMVYRNVIASADSILCGKILPFSWNGVTFNRNRDSLYTTSSISHSTTLLTTHGADSLLTMNLHLLANTHSTLFDTIVENQLPHTSNGITFHSDTTGALITIANANGCDSNITYSLFVYPNVYASADSTVCQNALPLLWNGVTFPVSALSQSSLPLLLSLNDTLLANTGADSILTMRLHVNRNTYNTYFDTVVENQLPRTFNGVVFNDSVSASSVIIPNSKGCDSIISYSLFVYRNVTATIDSTICQNSLPLSWNDSVFLAAGNKQTLLLTSHGADSLLTMRLHVNPNTYSILHDTIVQNQLPHTFHTLTLSGDTSHATVIIQNARGCDSIIDYSLYYWRNVTASADSVICQNSLPLSWNGATFNLPSSWRGPDTTIVHTALLQTSHGADSLLTMRLSVHPNTYSTYFDTVIENLLPRSFNDISFSNDTSNAIITIANANGCDSLISYSLFVHRNVATYLDSTICQSNLPLLWNNYTFQTAGTHTVTFPSATEADSVVMMRLFVNPTTYATLDSAIIENTLPLTWNGVTFNGSMMHATTTRYYDTLQNTLVNSRGCDSVVTMRLMVYRNVIASADSILCGKILPFSWNGVTFNRNRDSLYTTSSISHSTTLLTTHGADSLLTMNLHLLANTHSTLFDTIVENQLPHTSNGITFHSDTTGALITIANANGCDSNITYSLFVYPNVYASADSTVCQNALPLLWNGVTFPVSALSQSSLPLLLSLNDTLLANTGADSILTMRLHVNRNTYNTYFDTVVENQLPRTFNGVVFNDSVSASSVIIPNSKGCDSIISYSLFVYRNVTATIDSTICQNSLPLSWNDSVFLAAGNKQTLLLTSHGADSLLTMRLHVNPNTYSILHDTIVQNQLPHTFHTLTLSGDTSHATVIIQNARGCDSIIDYSLYYWRNVTASADSVICQNSLPLSWNGATFNLPSSWRGPDTTIVHTALLQTSHGADSLLTMRLSVHPNTYSTYFDTVIENLLPRSFNDISFSNDTSNAIITIANANGCDSLISYSLFVHRNVATYLD